MPDIDALNTELTADPLTRGYSGMSDEAAADDLNTACRERNRPTMTGSEVLNAIDIAEFSALSAEIQRRIWDVIHIGEINPFGVEAQLFIGAFGTESTTIASLQILRKEAISRGTELGLGVIRAGHVEEARR